MSNLFTMERHDRIWEIITEHLNMPMLENLGFAFSGGALFSMKYGEYRKSLDIDFMCPNECKQIVDNVNPMNIFKSSLIPYNITRPKPGYCNFLVNYKDEKFKIELFSIYVEPFETDKFNGVSSTSPCFSIMYKLMANAYRGYGRALNDRFQYRDMIDLIMLYKYHSELFETAYNKVINMNEKIANKLKKGSLRSLEELDIDMALNVFNIHSNLINDFKQNYEKLRNEIYKLLDVNIPID